MNFFTLLSPENAGTAIAPRTDRPGRAHGHPPGMAGKPPQGGSFPKRPCSGMAGTFGIVFYCTKTQYPSSSPCIRLSGLQVLMQHPILRGGVACQRHYRRLTMGAREEIQSTHTPRTPANEIDPDLTAAKKQPRTSCLASTPGGSSISHTPTNTNIPSRKNGMKLTLPPKTVKSWINRPNKGLFVNSV